MKIIRKQPFENGAFPPIQTIGNQETTATGRMMSRRTVLEAPTDTEALPEDCAKIPDDLDLSVYYEYCGFVVLEVENDIVVGMTPNTEAYEAWMQEKEANATETASISQPTDGEKMHAFISALSMPEIPEPNRSGGIWKLKYNWGDSGFTYEFVPDNE